MSLQLITLADFDLLKVDGPDSARFLQGQLTCNVERASDTQSVLGACCDIRGRVLADFRLFMLDGAYFLQVAKGTGESLKRTLDKYIVFSKAHVTLVTTEFQRFGLMGSDGDDAGRFETPQVSSPLQLPQHDGAMTREGNLAIIFVAAPSPRFEIYRKSDTSAAQSRPVLPLGAEVLLSDTTAWRHADVTAGIVHILPGMQEKYTPESVDYDLRGLIDFKKGCYTGQEIVARMHYRGKAKKRLYRVAAEAGSKPITHLSTHSGDAETKVDILSMVTLENSVELLAILPCDTAEHAQLTVCSGKDEQIHRTPARLLPLIRPATNQTPQLD